MKNIFSILGKTVQFLLALLVISAAPLQADETVGVEVRNEYQRTYEGSAGCLAVQLKSKPSGRVVLDFISADSSELVMYQESITFTPSNWNVSQNAIFTGISDLVVDGDQDVDVRIRVNRDETMDPAYLDLAEMTRVITIVNRDYPHIFVGEPSAEFISEDGDDVSFTVRLANQPAEDVTLEVGSTLSEEVAISPALLTFTPDNWNYDQVVRVSAIDDSKAESRRDFFVNFNNTSSEASGYAGRRPGDIRLDILDNDSAGIKVSPRHIELSEDGSARIKVEFMTQPLHEMYFFVYSRDGSAATVMPDKVVVTAENWDEPHYITVKGSDDDIPWGDRNVEIILTTMMDAYSDYSGMKPDDVRAFVMDDDIKSDDSDRDGAPDNEDVDPASPAVASVVAPEHNGRLTVDVSANPEVRLRNVAAYPVDEYYDNLPNRPDYVSFPYGMLEFDVENVVSGATIQLSLTLPEELPVDARFFRVDGDGFHEFWPTLAGNKLLYSLSGSGPAEDVEVTLHDAFAVAVPKALPVSQPLPMLPPESDSGCFISSLR